MRQDTRTAPEVFVLGGSLRLILGWCFGAGGTFFHVQRFSFASFLMFNVMNTKLLFLRFWKEVS